MHKRFVSPVCCCLLLSLVITVAGDKPAARALTSQPVAHPNAPPAAAGRKIVVDPVTGQRIPSRAQVTIVPLPPQAENALSTSGEGLQETRGVTRAGGMKIDLQGRFRSSVVATVGADGKVTTRCQTDSEKRDESKE
jgi:hypothetical protein